MKKFIFSILIMLGVAASSSAADNKMWIGGGIGFDYVTDADGDNIVSFGITPEFGYKFNNHWALAAELGYSIQNSYGDVNNTFIIGPYVRYTFFDNERLSFFGEFAFHYAHLDGDWDSDGIEMMLRPGMLLKLNDRWSLTGKINLLEYARVEDSDVFGLHITTGLSIGVLYNF